MVLLCAAPSSGQVDGEFLGELQPRSIGPTTAAEPVLSLAADMRTPYRVHAAFAGNGSWRAPAHIWREGAAGDREWIALAPGDPTAVIPDSRDPRFAYTLLRSGELRLFDGRTGAARDVSPWAPEGVELRFGDAAPLAVDPFRPERIYVGSQFVHRTGNRGESWQIISGDLAAGPEADTAGAVISSIAPSPVAEEVVWVGTANGRLHLTRSSGGTWTELSDGLPGEVPVDAGLAVVRASRHRAGSAFVAFEAAGEDRAPYVFRTADYGSSWERIGDGGGITGVMHALEQDPVRPELLFAGTGEGLHVSMDGGERWSRWTNGLPPVPVRSLSLHPRDHDLIVGTEGEGVWLVEDLRPLQEVARSPDVLAAPVHLFRPPDAHVHQRGGRRGYAVPGENGAGGEARGGRHRRSYGAVISYHVADAGPEGPLSLEVVDSRGNVVRRMEVPAGAGMHRIWWDLRVDPGRSAIDRAGEAPEVPLPRALPGRYTVRLGAETEPAARTDLRVLPDPRIDVPEAERRAKHEALLRAVSLSRVPARALRQLDEARAALRDARERIGAVSGGDDLAGEASRLLEHTRTLDAALRDVTLSRPRIRGLATSFDAPTEAQRIALQELEAEVTGHAERVNDFLLGELTLFNSRLREAGVEPLPEFDPVSY